MREDGGGGGETDRPTGGTQECTHLSMHSKEYSNPTILDKEPQMPPMMTRERDGPSDHNHPYLPSGRANGTQHLISGGGRRVVRSGTGPTRADSTVQRLAPALSPPCWLRGA